MKKLNLAIALALGLIVPFGVMASEGNEVNKYAMEMNEKSTEEVMKRVEMPDEATENATEEGVFKHRHTEEAYGVTQGKGKAYAGDTSSQGAGKKLKKKLGSTTGDHTGQGTGESVGDLDRDRIRDQDQEQIHDMDQDRDRDQEQDRSMEMDQDQIRDTDHVFDKVPPVKQQTDKK